ncbi:MAG: ATP synthase F1 subunit epsilon [Lentisphaeria bacterium]|nr:ATP synthase F1 subunit epsilon [Lentisphaeria bacterium]NQZ66629.1 ATP synthase F1 subunit epsilon [Lentisphaeria bacterium]
MAAFQFTILTAEGKAFDAEVDAVVANGIDGSFGIWANHAPMVSSLEHGPVKIDIGNETTFYAIGDGLLEIDGRNTVTILADNYQEADSLSDAKEKAQALFERLQADED